MRLSIIELLKVEEFKNEKTSCRIDSESEQEG